MMISSRGPRLPRSVISFAFARQSRTRVLSSPTACVLGVPEAHTEQRALTLRLREGKSAGEVAKTFPLHGMTIYRFAAAEASLKA
jgi:hypothetical protein